MSVQSGNIVWNKVRNLLLSQRFWALALGLFGLLSTELLGFEEVPDVAGLAGSVVLVMGFIFSYAWREPNVS